MRIDLKPLSIMIDDADIAEWLQICLLLSLVRNCFFRLNQGLPADETSYENAAILL